MKIEIVEKISYEVIYWCAAILGKSKYHDDFPILFVRYELGQKSTCFGEYDPDTNVIFVYTRMNQTVLQLINTVIHEYTHYLQSPSWISRYATKYSRKPNKNPYETEASSTANTLYKDCEKQLRSKIKKWQNSNSKKVIAAKKPVKVLVTAQKRAGKKV